MRLFCFASYVLSYALFYAAVPSSVISERVCFPFPIFILTPSMEFPNQSCMKEQHKFPQRHCLRQPIDATLEIYEGSEDVTSFYDKKEIQSVFNNNNDVGNNKKETNNSNYKNNHMTLTCIEMNDLHVNYSNTTTSMTTYKNISIHYRGSSSLNFRQKHQYAIKLQEPDNILGIGEIPERHWILYGEWIDGTLLRNDIAHWLYRSAGHYSPHTKPFVLFILEDNEEDGTKELKYHGLMLLMESITAPRLNLASLQPYCKDDELSGGWVWQYNPYKYGNIFANMKHDPPFMNFGMAQRPRIVYPKHLTKSMRDYFVDEKTGFLPRYYQYLYSNLTDNPEGLSDHINIDSFADYMLHTELSLNTDSYRRSIWFFKDRNMSINAGPVWDFNLAYGSGIAGSNNRTWIFQHHMSWRVLQCNYIFSARFIKRWKELRQNQWSNANLRNYVIQQTLPMKLMLTKCPYDLWQSDLLYCFLINPTGTSTYQMNVDLLVESIEARAQWMDEHITEIYQKLDKSFCGSEDKSPEYNCAADTRVDDCINDPMKYVNAVQKPTQEQSNKSSNSSSKECRARSLNSDSDANETITIDPCWLSVGDENLGQTPSTLFCSGFGVCNDDKDAKCQCNNNLNTYDCLPPNSTKKEKKKSAHASLKSPSTQHAKNENAVNNSSTKQHVISHGTHNNSNNATTHHVPHGKVSLFAQSFTLYWFSLLCLLVFLVGIFVYKLRSTRGYEPLLNRRNPPHHQYGSSNE